MSRPIEHPTFDFALRGWRDRSSETLHLRDCPDFERLGAELIEDATWRPDAGEDRLCPWCFPVGEGEPGGGGR